MTKSSLTITATDRAAEIDLMRPLSKSLDSQKLDKHRALVGLELEVLSKKRDRFAWDRDRGTYAHDRQLTDWMNALQDYQLSEVQAACAQAVIDSPNGKIHEGHIVSLIVKARKSRLARHPKPVVAEILDPIVTKEQAAKIMAEHGIPSLRPKPFQSERQTQAFINAAKGAAGE